VLDSNAARQLLKLARQAIEKHLGASLDLSKDRDVSQRDAAIEAPGGAFVTLHLKEGKLQKLRGCIGTFEASAPLCETVERMAVAAATRDPRFSPLSVEELDRLHIDISVLSPRTRVSAEQVEVGVHGLYISRRERGGVLLPQVAVEHQWDRETFLGQTCVKAGLEADAWRDDETCIEVFTAQILEE
jgi:AmmeMemoRadiSam system protein A